MDVVLIYAVLFMPARLAVLPLALTVHRSPAWNLRAPPPRFPLQVLPRAFPARPGGSDVGDDAPARHGEAAAQVRAGRLFVQTADAQLVYRRAQSVSF